MAPNDWQVALNHSIHNTSEQISQEHQESILTRTSPSSTRGQFIGRKGEGELELIVSIGLYSLTGRG